MEEVPNAVPTAVARRGAARNRRPNTAAKARFPEDSADVLTLTGVLECTY